MLSTRKVTIQNSQGMHARPAMQLVETSSRFRSTIAIRKGRQKVNAKSIMEVMTLEAVEGTELTLEAEGKDAEAAVEALARLIAEKFNED
jgi:phosphocarrier protein